jgi:L-alanine-DL-glutamate epimerase-like enolase superfamily enzyme
MRIDAIVLREIHMPLVRPFETSFGVTRNRRIVLAEVQSEGLTGWGECTAGEHPFFSGESTDSAWQVLASELAPMLAAESPEHGGECPRIFRAVRGNPMAKAARPREHLLRRFSRHPVLDSRAACHRRARAGRGLSAHQIKVQARLGC